jgi:hypothetical protein
VDRADGEDDGADPFGYFTMLVGPSSPSQHVHSDGVLSRLRFPGRASTTTNLTSNLTGILTLNAERGPSRSAPQPGEHMGGVSTGLLPAPVHTHVYITFGAGMQQREVDLFTASPIAFRLRPTLSGAA